VKVKVTVTQNSLTEQYCELYLRRWLFATRPRPNALMAVPMYKQQTYLSLGLVLGLVLGLGLS